MGILQELDKVERKLLMMAMKELGNPLGHIAFEHYPPEGLPPEVNFINVLIARGFMKITKQVPCRDTDDRVSGTRTFYSLTEDGVKVATELQTYLSRGVPDDLEGYRAYASRLFERLLSNAPAGADMRPSLETAKDQLNLLATRFEVISKTDEENETWSFDIIQRVGSKGKN